MAAEPAGPRTGVLLINLGTPDAPTEPAIRRYLAEFLSDRDVVDLPRALWWPILHGIILPLRPRRLVPLYAGIWRDEGAPLLAFTRQIARELQTSLQPKGIGPVAVGMRYGGPSLDQALLALQAAAVDAIVVLPLYPQYSGTTTGSALRALQEAMRRTGVTAPLRIIEDYHTDGGYTAALAASVREHWRRHGRGERLLMSFHGIPRRYVRRGDPYERHCHETAGLLALELGLRESEWRISFQSRVGRGRWLEPYTDDVLRTLARQGVRRLDVISPGFPADCLETLEEIAQRYAERFVEAGGEALRYVPALNARPDHVAALARMVLERRAA